MRVGECSIGQPTEKIRGGHWQKRVGECSIGQPTEKNKRSLAEEGRRMQHRAADRESKRRSLADEGRRMQHRAAVRACQAQRQKSECTKSASITQKNRLQHDAAYQKCHQVVCYKNQIKRQQCDAIFKEKNKDAQEHVQHG